MNISAEEAVNGFSRKIRHLDGREVTVAVDRPVATFDTVVVDKEGMPFFGSPWKKGQLFVNITVESPKVRVTPPRHDQCVCYLHYS